MAPLIGKPYRRHRYKSLKPSRKGRAIERSIRTDHDASLGKERVAILDREPIQRFQDSRTGLGGVVEGHCDGPASSGAAVRWNQIVRDIVGIGL